MISVESIHDPVDIAISNLAEHGTHLIGHADSSSLVNASADDWARFAQNWEDLKLDTFMADGGTYRYRRYSQFDLDVESGQLALLPHGPYRQKKDVNKLNGGIDRVYEPLTDAFVADPVLRNVLVKLAEIFTGIDGTSSWNIKVTPVRIVATADQEGLPTPEGRHKDGATFIASLLVGRSNVTGGESSVYTDDGELILSATLAEPGDILLGDDHRTLHGVTAVRPGTPDMSAYRDVVVLAYTSRSAGAA